MKEKILAQGADMREGGAHGRGRGGGAGRPGQARALQVGAPPAAGAGGLGGGRDGVECLGVFAVRI